MVVLYDADGKSAPMVGNAFVEKGIENTYVISGGFLGLCAICPEVLVGELPTEDMLAMAMARAGLKPRAHLFDVAASHGPNDVLRGDAHGARV